MNWEGLDKAYKLAEDNDLFFKQHVFVWGNQQPDWIDDLSDEEKLEEIEEWISEFCTRYPNTKQIDVVNEPRSNKPDGGEKNNGEFRANYISALGGEGTTGVDWIIKAFELARKRDNRVCSMEKANVMESGVLWREELKHVHHSEYPDVELSHMYADAGAMQLCRWPKQFDVIVTDNLFGDLLSDAAAMLTGSLGMLPSATLGPVMANGRPKAMYEPVHGSAPDIAGQGKANPIACILSFAMALRYSFQRGEEADLLERAIETVLANGARTPDLMGPDGGNPITTSAMGDAIIAALGH